MRNTERPCLTSLPWKVLWNNTFLHLVKGHLVLHRFEQHDISQTWLCAFVCCRTTLLFPKSIYQVSFACRALSYPVVDALCTQLHRRLPNYCSQPMLPMQISKIHIHPWMCCATLVLLSSWTFVLTTYHCCCFSSSADKCAAETGHTRGQQWGVSHAHYGRELRQSRYLLGTASYQQRELLTIATLFAWMGVASSSITRRVSFLSARNNCHPSMLLFPIEAPTLTHSVTFFPVDLDFLISLICMTRSHNIWHFTKLSFAFRPECLSANTTIH